MNRAKTILIVLTIASIAMINGRASGGEATKGVHYGDCVLSELDPPAFPPMLCLRPHISGYSTVGIGNSDSAGSYWRASGSSSLHFGTWTSAHAAGHVEEWRPNSPDLPIRHEGRADRLLVQLGNPADSRFRATVGKFDLPFGINHDPLPDPLLFQKNKQYWTSLKHAGRLTWDNRASTQIDLGMARGPSAAEGREGSMRIMHDIPSLEGTRISLSGAAHSLGPRRLAVSLLNINTKGDTTSFEWVLMRRTPDTLEQPDDRLYRVGYAAAFRRNTRWIIEYEDERSSYRLGALGMDARTDWWTTIRTALTYQKSEVDRKLSRWALTVGLEGEL